MSGLEKRKNKVYNYFNIKEVVSILKDYRDYRMDDMKNMDENELDQFIDSLGKFLNEAKAASTGVYLRNEMRIQQLLFCYAVMKKYTSGIDVTVDCKAHEPVKSIGSVTVEGNEIDLGDMEWFCRAAEFADSTEIYPLANGKSRLTFTFHGLIKKIG